MTAPPAKPPDLTLPYGGGKEMDVLWWAAGTPTQGHDAYPNNTSGTVFPAQWDSSPGGSWVEESQANPDADTSLNLKPYLYNVGGFGGGADLFQPGVIYVSTLVARQVSGTSSAQWYVGGQPRGAVTSYNKTQHSIFWLPEMQYTRDDYYAEASLTLRVWGGTVRLGHLAVLSRPIVLDAQALVDGADGATTATDTDSVVGTVAVVPKVGVAVTNKKFLKWTASLSHDEYFVPNFTRKHVNGLTPNPASGWYYGYSSFPANIQVWMYPDGVFAGGDGIYQESSSALWSGYASFGMYQVPGTTNYPNFWSPAGWGSMARTDSYEIVNGHHFDFHADQSHDLEQWYDQLFLCRGRLCPTMTAPSQDTVITPGTLSVTWTNPGTYAPQTYDGYIYDAGGNVMDSAINTTSPWTANTSTLEVGDYATVVIYGQYDDGSYGWDQRNVIVGSGGHLLPLTGAGQG